jgi:putative tryptophan/tyrosine transport system substrate-binding protein
MLDIRRRQFITLLGSAAVAWPLAARAQQQGKRVGWLGPGLDNPVQSLGRQVLLAELRKLGFTEGQNLTIEHRPTGEGVAKAFTGANELVAATVIPLAHAVAAKRSSLRVPLDWVCLFRPTKLEQDNGTGRIEVAEHRCR